MDDDETRLYPDYYKTPSSQFSPDSPMVDPLQGVPEAEREPDADQPGLIDHAHAHPPLGSPVWVAIVAGQVVFIVLAVLALYYMRRWARRVSSPSSSPSPSASASASVPLSSLPPKPVAGTHKTYGPGGAAGRHRSELVSMEATRPSLVGRGEGECEPLPPYSQHDEAVALRVAETGVTVRVTQVKC